MTYNNDQYTPWHEHIDEDLIKEAASKFVKDLWAKGLKLTNVKVEWGEDGEFDVSATGARASDPPATH